MNRKEFVAKAMAMGLGLAVMPSLFTSCKKEELLNPNFSGDVLIIGAGSAGLMAGYTLNRYGINFRIIEASSVYGGRVKISPSFADFPIDLGAEWVHAKPDIFSQLINDPTVPGQVDLLPYQLETMYSWNNGAMHRQNWAHPFYGEYKFKSTTWYQFFEQFIVPGISDKIVYDSPVAAIDYSGSRVSVTDIHGNTYTADRVIVTVPLNILKSGSITFSPALPASKTDALAKTDMPDGLKVFIKFSQKFYPDILLVGGLISGSDAERIYYDAAFKKNTNDHVLALFNVGPNAADFTNLGSDQAIFEAVMADLDMMFDGQASRYYESHVVQNWSAEPYIQGSYTFGGDNYEDTIAALVAPLDNKLFFAGEALDTESWATVHGAGNSGRTTAEAVLVSG